jgi:8-oxo-dGTP pyrophosphatase MutT (NUDIX family)
VAICIRLVPTAGSSSDKEVEHEDEVPETVDDFFRQDWTRREGVRAEVLYIRRSRSKGDRWSSQVAFPGGKKDFEDEDGLYTAKRETWEEIGIDLADEGWLNVGRLGTSARRDNAAARIRSRC